MAKKVQSGIGFYGAVGGRLEAAGATMFRNVHQQAMAVPEHEHPTAYFALLLQGNYREPGRGDEIYFTPFTVAYQPEGTRHRGKVEACGCDFFTVEVSPQVLHENEIAKHLAAPVFERDGGKLLWLTLRLYSEYSRQECCTLTVESLLLELFAGAARSSSLPSCDEPSRWRIMREKLHDDFREPLRVKHLAGAAGVHPVHAARIFRRFSGRTPGEYLQQLRVQAACRMIAENKDSLSDVAFQSGFSDQSHMNRTFKRFVGATPGAFLHQLELSHVLGHTSTP
jgi:AraC family transcriptional regulator